MKVRVHELAKKHDIKNKEFLELNNKQLNFFKYTSISNKHRLLISHKDSI